MSSSTTYAHTWSPSSAFKSVILDTTALSPSPLKLLLLLLLLLLFVSGDAEGERGEEEEGDEGDDTRMEEGAAQPLCCGDKSAGARPRSTTPLAKAEKYSWAVARSAAGTWSRESAITRALAPSRAACR
jgi:hypothetical protein